jgi:4-amino-4-deoxy-L-arabinose transferase-like glycosyltransferase
MEEKIKEKTRESEFEKKLKKWLKNKNNLLFLALIIITLFLGFHFFSITKTQALWWDEADYLAYAKNIAGENVDWIVTEKHNSLFPFIVAGFFILGFSEAITKFFVELLPYFLVVLLTYFTASTMYNKKVGIIAGFLMATSWTILFNAMRFHVGIPSILFGILAIYVFWQGYEKKQKIFGKISPNWTIPLTVFLLLISYSLRRSSILFGLFFFIYFVLISDWKKEIKNKYNWIGLILFLVLFFLIDSIIFSSTLTNVSQGYIHPENQFSLGHLKVFSLYFKNYSNQIFSVLLYLFWIGFAFIVLNLLISFGYIKKNSKTRSDLFVLISIITTLLFFILTGVSGDVGEPRWYFPLFFGSLVCIARFSDFLFNNLKKYNKELAILIIILLIGFGGYYQIQHAKPLIENKAQTYQGIQQAGIYLNKISNSSDKVLTLAQPQVSYYGEISTVHARNFVDADSSSADHFPQTLEKLEKNKDIKYLVISFSEPGYPSWMKTQTSTAWEIPFMDTKIDLQTGTQNIIQNKTSGNLTFVLKEIKQDVFIYEILHN